MDEILAKIFRCPPFKLSQGYLDLTTIDVGPIKKAIDELGESAWYENRFRQHNFKVHHQTNTLFLIWSRPGTIQNPLYSHFENVLKPIMDFIKKFYGYSTHVWTNIIFAKLGPGDEVFSHIDVSKQLRNGHRIHLPIETNDDVHFMIDGKLIHFREGQLFEFDNTRMHSVKNNGSTPRIHLIIDYFLQDFGD